MIRILLSTIILTMFAAAAAVAQPVDMPGKDKSHDDAARHGDSSGLGRTRGSSGGDKRGSAEEAEENDDQADDQGNQRRRKDRRD